MKKYNLNTADARVDHFLQSKNVIYIRTQDKKKFQIHEENGNYESYSEQDYLNSLNNRRLLRTWEKCRSQVKIAPHLPEIIKVIIYENTFDDLESLVIQSHKESNASSINSQSIQQLFSKMKEIAILLNRDIDANYWHELIDFFQTCFQSKILTESFQRSAKEVD
ncbi:hypothetical protein [Shimazuella alba]|jgi:hypothetical protein|uniref:Uncharacterized protein n=1 Tax=Shimazuella alba TaxID=2690964 RepID=A0A6I4W135_9BACL|nr:hypothetical protein [Shimazuella alba]MXQ55970.1 hypothetical protein [Shimazuella alba]